MPSFLDRLKQGGAVGSWCSFASFASVEVMAQLGFDFLVLDMQHCEISQAFFPAVFGAFPAAGPTPIVRVAQNDYHLINWLFDQGAPAVLVPMVNSPAAARKAVAAAKFPPLGRRSFGPHRASSYSRKAEEYMDRADHSAVLVIQIESRSAVERINEILDVPGIDAVFMGPNDLAFSMLKPGETYKTFRAAASGHSEGQEWTAFARTPEVLALCDQVREAADARGMPFGMTAGSAEEAAHWLSRGASFVTLGSDFVFMQSGAKHLRRGLLS
jgi:4-hydroxy-2-oxoheptanedioate aldolase